MWGILEGENLLELCNSYIHFLLELLQTVYLQCADRTPIPSGELFLDDESCIHQIVCLLEVRIIPIWVVYPFPFDVVKEYQVSVDLTDSFQDCMCNQ